MLVLINDYMQIADAKAAYPELTSPSLADTHTVVGGSIYINFNLWLGTLVNINYLGIGNTDGTWFQLGSDTSTRVNITRGTWDAESYINGLYAIPDTGRFPTNELYITTDATYIGRLGVGVYNQYGGIPDTGVYSIGCSPPREPGFWSTEQTRRTISGQLIRGAGGITGRQIDVDTRYKITAGMIGALERSAADGSLNLPYFIEFDKETARMPWARLYATIEGTMIFQSSINRFLYSKKFRLKEAF